MITSVFWYLNFFGFWVFSFSFDRCQSRGSAGRDTVKLRSFSDSTWSFYPTVWVSWVGDSWHGQGTRWQIKFVMKNTLSTPLHITPPTVCLELFPHKLDLPAGPLTMPGVAHSWNSHGRVKWSRRIRKWPQFHCISTGWAFRLASIEGNWRHSKSEKVEISKNWSYHLIQGPLGSLWAVSARCTSSLKAAILRNVKNKVFLELTVWHGEKS